MDKKLVCLIQGPIGTVSGYGSHLRDITRALISLDKYDIKIWPLRWGNCPQNYLTKGNPNDDMIIDRLLDTPQLPQKPDIFIQMSVPNEFQPLGQFSCGITAGIETTMCPIDWIHGLNRMNLNIVPSTFSRDIFANIKFDELNKETHQLIRTHKLERPIEVLFEGVDTNIYGKTDKFSEGLVNELKGVKESFAFLFVGHWINGGLGNDRKDVGMLVKTFLHTFRNMEKAPALILKTSGGNFSVLDREDILTKINQIKNTIVANKYPSIYLLHGDLTDVEMNQLNNHPKVKAHISFTHGEGFGRPLLEATLSEKPVIVSNWSGHTDFLNKEWVSLLPGSLTKVKPESFPKGIYVENSEWYTVNYSYASQVMKDVYKHYKNYTFNAKKQAKANISKFSFDMMTKKLGEILDQYLPEITTTPELRLPKLKRIGPVESSKPPMSLPKLKKI